MKISRQLLGMFSLVLLSSIVTTMFIVGFAGESIKILFVKIKNYKIPHPILQSLHTRFKFDKKLAY